MQKAIILCLSVFFFWSSLLTYKYLHFGYYDWDLALYDQILWNICHGSLTPSLMGVNFLADHVHLIAFLIAPVYALFPHPLTLINLEILSFCMGAFIFYKIARTLIAPSGALLLMVLYIIHPANVFMLFYEFHFESLNIVFIFLLFYFMREDKYGLFLITAIILMLIKENMPLIVLMFGIYGLLFKKGQRLKWGLVPVALSLAIFIFTMFIFVPFIRKSLSNGNNIYWSFYANLGNSPQSILATIFLEPWKFVHLLWTHKNILYLKELFGPFLLTPFLSPHILLLSLPIFMQNMLSSAWTQHTIYFHYAATIVPFIALASLHSLTWIKTKMRPKLFTILLILMTVSAVYNCSRFIPQWKHKVKNWADPLDIARQRLIDQIPQNAEVVASFDFLSHLTHHKAVYAFYTFWRDANYFTGESPFQLPSSVQYALIDHNDPWLKADLANEPQLTRQRVDRFFANGHWKVKSSYSTIVLYERTLQ